MDENANPVVGLEAVMEEMRANPPPLGPVAPVAPVVEAPVGPTGPVGPVGTGRSSGPRPPLRAPWLRWLP